MTIEKRVLSVLESGGFFPDQAAAVLAAAKQAPESASMEGRWQEDESAYPPAFLAVIMASMRRHALEYIEANCPNAWFKAVWQ